MSFTVMVVDDNASFRKELSSSLSREYNIVEAADSSAAVQKLKNPNVIDIILLDVVLPGLRGTELLKILKDIDPRVKIIIMTGFGSKKVVVEALRNNADEYLEKPFNITKVIQMINTLLGEKTEEQTDGPVDKIQYFIHKNPDKNISLNQAAEIVNLSPKYISRLFKEKTGKGFNAYKIENKINIAKSLLENTSYNINEISYKIGYKSSESFVRIFKRITGATPKYFREKRLRPN